MQFDFGKNWLGFSKRALSTDKIQMARSEFLQLFKDIPLKDKTFLDIGFGQGISILLAKEAGAIVTGNDINPKCKEALQVTSTKMNSTIDFPIIIGSILEKTTLNQLTSGTNTFDIVHSWGVLHHTGAMAEAIKNASSLVKDTGYFVLAIYNRHWSSIPWLIIKWLYCKMPWFFKRVLLWVFYPIIAIAKFIATGKNPFKQNRGMDFYYNVVDWVGGYPYEYASLVEMVCLMNKLGFPCIKSIPAEVPTGCNEFVFQKLPVKKD